MTATEIIVILIQVVTVYSPLNIEYKSFQFLRKTFKNARQKKYFLKGNKNFRAYTEKLTNQQVGLYQVTNQTVQYSVEW